MTAGGIALTRPAWQSLSASALIINKCGKLPECQEAKERGSYVKILHEKALKEASLLPDPSSGSMIKTRPRGIPFVFENNKEFADGIVFPVLGDNPVFARRGEGMGDGELPTRYIHALKELGKYLR